MKELSAKKLFELELTPANALSDDHATVFSDAEITIGNAGYQIRDMRLYRSTEAEVGLVVIAELFDPTPDFTYVLCSHEQFSELCYLDSNFSFVL